MNDEEYEAIDYLVEVGLMRVTHIVDGHYRVWGKTPLLDKKLKEETLTETEKEAMVTLYGRG